MNPALHGLLYALTNVQLDAQPVAFDLLRASVRSLCRVGALILLCSTLSLGLGGCASTSPQGSGPQGSGFVKKPANTPYMPATMTISADRARNVAILDGRSGVQRAWPELVNAASSADVVLIGENHGHELGLAAAAMLFQDILAQSPNAALSMEFLERDQQVAVDDYLVGVTDEAGFAKASARTASSYPAGHRAMVEAARIAKRPIIAANAPRRYVRLARIESYERLGTLTYEQTRLFRVPTTMPSGRYRDSFGALMASMRKETVAAPVPTTSATSATPATTSPDIQSLASSQQLGHPLGDPLVQPTLVWTPQMEGLFRAQALWDWTMADSIASLIARGTRQNYSKPVVHVIGRFHVDYEGGTVQALRQLAPDARIITITFIDANPPNMNNLVAAATPLLAEEDKDRADFVIYVGPFSDLDAGAGQQ